MTISPEALAKAQAIDWTRIDDALISCAGLLKTLCRDNIGDTAASELEYARSVIAALQAERDAATPKLPDDLAGLVAELRDAARLNAGPLGPEARAEHRALTAIQSLVARNAELRAEIAALKKEAADVVRPFAELSDPYIDETPDDYPAESIVPNIANIRAARSFLDKVKGR